MDNKKTCLYDSHISLGGRIVSFAGYLLPVQYTGVIEEHLAVRTKAGLFDVSHMGEILLSGKDSFANVQNLLTNDFTSLAVGRARYSPMCNENGGIVDDLIVYRTGEESYFIVVNAANKDKDAEWIKSRLFGDVSFADQSDSYAQLALQGPLAEKILSKCTDQKYIPEKHYSFIDNAVCGGVKCLVSRTGYTGEDGFELYCDSEDAVKLWELLLDAGREDGLIPCGLGARDTLRLEAAMPLYGHEMNEEITPFEVGITFAVKMDKDDFIGKNALVEKGSPKLIRVGLEVTSRGIVREGCELSVGDERVGISTSGTFCPYIDGARAMALVDAKYAAEGTVMNANVRGRNIEAKVVKLPFYKR